MSNTNDVCCEWQRQAPEYHDLLIDALKADDQESYNWLRDQQAKQAQLRVLPMDQIAAIDFGNFAQLHKDEISFDSMMTAIAVSSMTKTNLACIVPLDTITMKVSK